MTARREDTSALGQFRKWIIDHIDSWFAYTEQLGIGIRMEDIVLVTGCHRTRSWSNIVITQATEDHISLGVEIADAVGANVNWGRSDIRIQGALYSQGPSGEVRDTQMIKRNFFKLLPRVEAAAEPKPDPPGDDREPEKEVIPMTCVSEV